MKLRSLSRCAEKTAMHGESFADELRYAAKALLQNDFSLKRAVWVRLRPRTRHIELGEKTAMPSREEPAFLRCNDSRGDVKSTVR